MSNGIVRVIQVCAVLLITAATAPAQRPRADSLPQLPTGLGASAQAVIRALMDSVKSAGLPPAPLADKAAEGILKGADDARIIAAVRSLTRELGTARTILGDSAGPAVLSTVASAIHAGIPEASLREIAHPAHGTSPGPQVLESALVTAVDLVAKHVEPTAATASIRALLDRHASAQQFLELRAEVDQAIRSGQSPAAALDARTRAHIQRLDHVPGGGNYHDIGESI